MISNWFYKTLDEQQTEIKNRLAEELNISPILAQLLVQRDIFTYEDARQFFRPDLSMLHDPFLMKDMVFY